MKAPLPPTALAPAALRTATLLLAALLLTACATAGQPPPATVATVDLARYAGTWHEVARLPNWFQDSATTRCAGVTATYTPRADGTVGVRNACRNLAEAGKEDVAQGWARASDPSNARLRVTFFWPFFGDYWVIGLDPDYRWAVVGTPGRDYLWILSRTPAMAPGDLAAAMAIAGREGFPLDKLRATPP